MTSRATTAAAIYSASQIKSATIIYLFKAYETDSSNSRNIYPQ